MSGMSRSHKILRSTWDCWGQSAQDAAREAALTWIANVCQQICLHHTLFWRSRANFYQAPKLPAGLEFLIDMPPSRRLPNVHISGGHTKL